MEGRIQPAGLEFATCALDQEVMGSIPVRAHAWVVGLVLGWGECRRQLTDISLLHGCFFLSLCLPSPHLPFLSKITEQVLG